MTRNLVLRLCTICLRKQLLKERGTAKWPTSQKVKVEKDYIVISLKLIICVFLKKTYGNANIVAPCFEEIVDACYRNTKAALMTDAFTQRVDLVRLIINSEPRPGWAEEKLSAPTQ